MSGVRVRPFLQLLSAAARLAESIFLEPNVSTGTMNIRAVNDDKNVHFLATIPASFFDSFKMGPNHSDSRVGGHPGGLAVTLAVNSHSGNFSSASSFAQGMGMSPPVPAPAINVQIMSKALHASVLRCTSPITHLQVLMGVRQFPRSGVPTATSCDVVVLRLQCHTGCSKTYFLHTGEITASEKANLQTDQYPFAAVADPRLWGGVFSSFPGAMRQIGLQPLEHRIVLQDATPRGDGTNAVASSHVSVDAKLFQQFPRMNSIQMLPGKLVDFKPIRLFAGLADVLQLSLRLLMGPSGAPVFWEGVARDGTSLRPADQVVTHLSLVVAASDVDVASGAPVPKAAPLPSTSASASRAQSVLRSSSLYGRSSMHMDLSLADTVVGPTVPDDATTTTLLAAKSSDHLSSHRSVSSVRIAASMPALSQPASSSGPTPKRAREPYEDPDDEDERLVGPSGARDGAVGISPDVVQSSRGSDVVPSSEARHSSPRHAPFSEFQPIDFEALCRNLEDDFEKPTEESDNDDDETDAVLSGIERYHQSQGNVLIVRPSQ